MANKKAIQMHITAGIANNTKIGVNIPKENEYICYKMNGNKIKMGDK